MTNTNCIAAGCLAHARRKFDGLLLDGATNAVVFKALKRIAAIYRVERELAQRTSDKRLVMRGGAFRPLWDELHAKMAFERWRVPDDSSTAKVIDYSLRHLECADAQPARHECRWTTTTSRTS